MDYLRAALTQHGYLVIFVFVFTETLDLPVPASLALIAGGAVAAMGVMRAPMVLLAGVAAFLLGDSLTYLLGRYTGWALLGLLCRVSANPETCILRSAEMFYKRGKSTLVVAKFIPGINVMAPPLAGSLKMRFEQFLWLDLAGASLYILGFETLGFLFHRFLFAIASVIGAAGHVAGVGALLLVAAYAGHRFWLFRRGRIYRVVPRIQVEELARKLKSQEAEKILVADVRSHGYYDQGAARIQGSIRIEPNNLADELKRLPPDKDFYLYCT